MRVVDTSAWVECERHRQHKLATADAIVYATAQTCSADLLTCDAHLGNLPAVVFVPKGTA